MVLQQYKLVPFTAKKAVKTNHGDLLRSSLSNCVLFSAVSCTGSLPILRCQSMVAARKISSPITSY